MWRSPVARAVRVGEAVGSNPSIPTQKPLGITSGFAITKQGLILSKRTQSLFFYKS